MYTQHMCSRVYLDFISFFREASSYLYWLMPTSCIASTHVRAPEKERERDKERESREKERYTARITDDKRNVVAR